MAKTKLPYYPGLDGLRGLAVSAMLVFHAWPVLLPGGFLSVSTFFTLSGFLITGLLFKEWQGADRIAFGEFWSRRLRRLMPAALLGLTGIAIGTLVWGDSVQRGRVTSDALSALFYSANWWAIVTGADYDDLMGSPSPIQHFWSLSIEEQYYMVYPLLAALVLWVSRGSRLMFGVVLVVATTSSWSWMARLAASDVPTARVYFGTDTRCAEIMAGGVLALGLLGRESVLSGRYSWLFRWIGVVGLAVTVIGWRVADVQSIEVYNWGLPVYTLSSICIIVSALTPSGPIGALLSAAPLCWLGRVSYGLYIYHWPVLLWLTPERTGLHPVVTGVVGIGLSVLLAAISHRWVESPIRSGRWFVGAGRWAAAPASMLAVVVALLATSEKTPSVLAEEVVALASAPEPWRSDRENDERLRILVFGDSLAKNVGAGLVFWGWGAGKDLVRVRNMGTPGCGIARGAWVEQFRDKLICDRWPTRILNAFEQFRPDVVVLLSEGWDLVKRQLPEWPEPRFLGDPVFDRWLIDEYGQILDLLYGAGVDVVWLTAPCIETGREEGNEEDIRRKHHFNRSILPTVEREYGAGRMTVIDLFGEVCPEGKYSKSLHGIPDFRSDGIHFSIPARGWVGAWLGPQLVNLHRDASARSSSRQ